MQRHVLEGLLGWMFLAGCGGVGEDALAPIMAVLEAAQQDDPAGLSELCDPEGHADSDARRVCAAHPDHPRDWALFRAWFGRARILGLASSAPGKDEMHIALAIGPDERRVEVTVVRRGARWYLLRL